MEMEQNINTGSQKNSGLNHRSLKIQKTRTKISARGGLNLFTSMNFTSCASKLPLWISPALQPWNHHSCEMKGSRALVFIFSDAIAKKQV